MIVERLSAEFSGKAQMMFCRISPHKFVPFYSDEETTVENIKLAHEKHFNVLGDLRCDVLAGKQVSSCKTIDQVPDVMRFIHVRFIKCDEDEMLGDGQEMS